MAGTDWAGLNAAIIAGMSGNMDPTFGIQMQARRQKMDEDRQTLEALQGLVGEDGAGIMNPQVLMSLFSQQGQREDRRLTREQTVADRDLRRENVEADRTWNAENNPTWLRAEGALADDQSRRKAIADLRGVAAIPPTEVAGPFRFEGEAPEAIPDPRAEGARRILNKQDFGVDPVLLQAQLDDLLGRGEERVKASTRSDKSLEAQLEGNEINREIAAATKARTEGRQDESDARRKLLDEQEAADRAKPKPAYIETLLKDLAGGSEYRYFFKEMSDEDVAELGKKVYARRRSDPDFTPAAFTALANRLKTFGITLPPPPKTKERRGAGGEF